MCGSVRRFLGGLVSPFGNNRSRSVGVASVRTNMARKLHIYNFSITATPEYQAAVRATPHHTRSGCTAGDSQHRPRHTPPLIHKNFNLNARTAPTSQSKKRAPKRIQWYSQAFPDCAVTSMTVTEGCDCEQHHACLPCTHQRSRSRSSRHTTLYSPVLVSSRMRRPSGHPDSTNAAHAASMPAL